MPQTLSFNLVHVIFSTKGRVPLVNSSLSGKLYAYIAGTARDLECERFRVGGVADHIHLAMRLAPMKSSAKVVSQIKAASSAWMKQQV